MFKRLADFKRDRRHTHVPTGWYDQTLAVWVRTQRGNANRRNPADRLSAVRRRRLEELGFSFSIDADNWERRFAQLGQYAEKHGHCDVPRFAKEFGGLGIWVSHQRNAERAEKLEPFRRERLSALGFVFNPRQCRWDDWLRRLAAFRDQHGHANVPRHSKEVPALSDWLGQQQAVTTEGGECLTADLGWERRVLLRHAGQSTSRSAEVALPFSDPIPDRCGARTRGIATVILGWQTSTMENVPPQPPEPERTAPDGTPPTTKGATESAGVPIGANSFLQALLTPFQMSAKLVASNAAALTIVLGAIGFIISGRHYFPKGVSPGELPVAAWLATGFVCIVLTLTPLWLGYAAALNWAQARTAKRGFMFRLLAALGAAAGANYLLSVMGASGLGPYIYEFLHLPAPPAGQDVFVVVHSASGAGQVVVRFTRVKTQGLFEQNNPVRIGVRFNATNAELTKLETMAAFAQRFFFGMTEGKIQVRNIVLYNNVGAGAGACGGHFCNVLIHSGSGRASCLSVFNQVSLFDEEWKDNPFDSLPTWTGGKTLAHEWGHCLLGLPDEYSDHGPAGSVCAHSDDRCNSAMSNQANNFNLCNSLDHGRDPGGRFDRVGHVCAMCATTSTCTGACNTCLIGPTNSWDSILGTGVIFSKPAMTSNFSPYRDFATSPFSVVRQ